MKDSLDILLDNISEDVTEYKPEFVAHDSLNILRTDVICHHGILGMKWGIRRYQNKDGSLTAAGVKRYNKSVSKRAKANSFNERYKLQNEFRKNLKKYISDKEAEEITKAINYGEKEDEVYKSIIEKFTKEKFDSSNKTHYNMLDDLRNYGEAVAGDKLGNDKYGKLAKEWMIKSWERDTPKGYKLSDDSKKNGQHIAYEKESGPEKQHQYKLFYEPSMHSTGPSKQHEEFEKNSDKILKDCFDASYKDVKNSLGEDFNVSKEDFIKMLDKPSVRIIPDWNMAEITTWDSFTDHFPTIEYDLKNKKVLRTSLDG